jgi:hypothetical protein
MWTGDTRNYVRGRMLTGMKKAIPTNKLPENFQDFLLLLALAQR